jgi:hypothetical protein
MVTLGRSGYSLFRAHNRLSPPHLLLPSSLDPPRARAEKQLDAELMTPYAERGGVAMPLSRITAGALEDLVSWGRQVAGHPGRGINPGGVLSGTAAVGIRVRFLSPLCLHLLIGRWPSLLPSLPCSSMESEVSTTTVPTITPAPHRPSGASLPPASLHVMAARPASGLQTLWALAHGAPCLFLVCPSQHLKGGKWTKPLRASSLPACLGSPRPSVPAS